MKGANPGLEMLFSIWRGLLRGGVTVKAQKLYIILQKFQCVVFKNRAQVGFKGARRTKYLS